VALAQARKSSPGEWPSRSGEPVSPRRVLNSGKIKKTGRTFAQARLVRLDELISRSSDPSSPRRDFAQEQRCASWCFRSGESHSPRWKYQATNLFPHAVAQFSSHTIQSLTNSWNSNINQKLNMQFRLINEFPIQFEKKGLASLTFSTIASKNQLSTGRWFDFST